MATHGADPEKSALQSALLERLHQEQHVKHGQQRQMLDEERKLRDIQSTVSNLHEKLRRPVMVPFGKVAFFQGELVHTNELLVKQGQHMIECTSKQAGAMLGRRLAETGSRLEGLEQELQIIKDQINEAQQLAVNEEGEGIVDIREEWDEGMPSGVSAREPEAAGSAHFPAGQGMLHDAVDSGGEEDLDAELAGSDAAFGDEIEDEAGGEEEEGGFEALMVRMEELEILEQQQEEEEQQEVDEEQCEGPARGQQQQQPLLGQPRPAAPAAARAKGGLKPGFLLGKPKSAASQRGSDAGHPSLPGSGAASGSGGADSGAAAGRPAASHSSRAAFTGLVRERQAPAASSPAGQAAPAAATPDPGTPQFSGRDPLSSGLVVVSPPTGSSNCVPAAACFPPVGLLDQQQQYVGQQEWDDQPRVSRFKQRRHGGL